MIIGIYSYIIGKKEYVHKNEIMFIFFSRDMLYTNNTADAKVGSE